MVGEDSQLTYHATYLTEMTTNPEVVNGNEWHPHDVGGEVWPDGGPKMTKTAQRDHLTVR